MTGYDGKDRRVPEEVDAKTRLFILETAKATADEFESKLGGFRMSVTCDERHKGSDSSLKALWGVVMVMVAALIATAIESFTK